MITKQFKLCNKINLCYFPNIINAIDPITDAVVYYGHKKTGNQYLTGVQLEGCRKWSIFVQYLSSEFVEDRLKLLPLHMAFVVIFHSAAKTS